jgi:hypothetical protein
VPIITAFDRLRKENHEFKNNLGYIVIPVSKKKKEKQKQC